MRTSMQNNENAMLHKISKQIWFMTRKHFGIFYITRKDINYIIVFMWFVNIPYTCCIAVSHCRRGIIAISNMMYGLTCGRLGTLFSRYETTSAGPA